jgi:hypothetical protein
MGLAFPLLHVSLYLAIVAVAGCGWNRHQAKSRADAPERLQPWLRAMSESMRTACDWVGEEDNMRRLAALVLALSLVGSIPLSGQKPKKHRAKSQETQVTVVFIDTQRESARSYFKQHGRGSCPPGLAKKNNGCLPPGQAKKRYVIGHPLPHGVVVGELPIELSVRIGPAPAGYRYGMIDGDVVKLALGTMFVVDAIEGLVR